MRILPTRAHRARHICYGFNTLPLDRPPVAASHLIYLYIRIYHSCATGTRARPCTTNCIYIYMYIYIYEYMYIYVYIYM